MSETQAVLPGCNSTESEYSHSEAILRCLCGCGRERPASKRRGRFQRYYATDACRARMRNRRIAKVLAAGGAFASQPALPGQSRVRRLFDAWIGTEQGRRIEAEFVRLALEDKAAGERRGEAGYYFSTIRRLTRGLGRDAQGFKCNHIYRSHLARRVMERNADLAGFFETRRERGVR